MHNIKATNLHACHVLDSTGSDEGGQQEDGSPNLQMQTNPCYAVTHQGQVEDREEDITVDGHMHEVQMVENPSYAYNTCTVTTQNICLHDKLDCTIIYEKV